MTSNVNPWAAAACADEWETFEAADTGDRRAARDALAMCHGCPVLAACLESTLAFERANSSDVIALIAGGNVRNDAFFAFLAFLRFHVFITFPCWRKGFGRTNMSSVANNSRGSIAFKSEVG